MPFIPVFFQALFCMGAGSIDGTSIFGQKDSLPVFSWYFIYSGPDSSQASVFIIVDASDTLSITTTGSPLGKGGIYLEPDSLITGKVILSASAWWAGFGDAVLLVIEEGRYFVYWKEIDEENGWLPAKRIGEIILPSSPGSKAKYIK